MRRANVETISNLFIASPVFILLGIYFISNPNEILYADDFDKSAFKYRKELIPQEKSGKSWGVSNLDEEVYRNSHYNDLRIYQADTMIPYRRENKLEVYGKSGFVIPKILFRAVNQNTYVLEVPRIPENHSLDSLEVKSPHSFETNMKIELGNEPDKMQVQKNEFFFQYDNMQSEERKKIVLQTPYYKFIRITTDSNTSLEFLRLYYIPVSQIPDLQFEFSIPKSVLNSDLRSLVYYFPNEKNLPFTKIGLNFAEQDFQRAYQLSAFINKEYQLKSQGSLESRSGKSREKYQVTILLPDSIRTAWKLEIFHGDNKPLELTEAIGFHPQERLLFPLQTEQSHAESSPIYLYYGNKYARQLDFDLSGFPYEKIEESCILFNPGKETENPDFAYSVFRPPVSLWILRGLFLIGLGFVGFSSYRILRRFSES